MRSCPDTPKVSSYAPCTPFGCHLCLQCHPTPLGLTECLPHLLLVILSSWLSPPPAPLLVSSGSWDTPAFSGLQLCRILCIIVMCSQLVAFLHAESSRILTFLFPPRLSPVSLQSNSHPKSSLLPAVPVFVSWSSQPLSPSDCACIAHSAWARMGCVRWQELPGLRDGLGSGFGLQ